MQGLVEGSVGIIVGSRDFGHSLVILRRDKHIDVILKINEIVDSNWCHTGVSVRERYSLSILHQKTSTKKPKKPLVVK